MKPPSSEDFFALVKTYMPDFHRVACSETEEEFCEAVGLAVRHCLEKLEDRRKLLVNAGELELSTDLADLLTRGGVPTTAEPHVNGHVDLVVSHFEAGRYRMLGECKLYRTPRYHCDGTTQVLGYYSGAGKRVFCLDFCKKPDVNGRMDRIRQHFSEDNACHSVVETIPHELPWSFLGIHQHASGATVEVLHIGCNLHVPGAQSRDGDAEEG